MYALLFLVFRPLQTPSTHSSLKYRKSSVNPPSLIRPPFQRRIVNKTLPPPHPLLILHKKIDYQSGLISYGLFKLEVHIVFGLRPHDLQLHMLNFLNFAL